MMTETVSLQHVLDAASLARTRFLRKMDEMDADTETRQRAEGMVLMFFRVFACCLEELSATETHEGG